MKCPFLKAVKGLGVTGPITASALAGALADMTLFDPKEPRVSNLIKNLAPGVRIPLVDYLASKESDTAVEGRLKNAIEGLIFGGAFDIFMKIAKAMKASARFRKLTEGSKKPGPTIEDVSKKGCDDAGEAAGKKAGEKAEGKPGRKEYPTERDYLEKSPERFILIKRLGEARAIASRDIEEIGHRRRDCRGSRRRKGSWPRRGFRRKDSWLRRGFSRRRGWRSPNRREPSPRGIGRERRRMKPSSVVEA
jgi:hypothetical protein